MTMVRSYQFRWLAVGCLIFLLYVSSYMALSRRGFAEADEGNLKGFFYLSPEDSFRWRCGNTCCLVAFAPCNGVDRWLGCGRVPSVCEPLGEMSP